MSDAVEAFVRGYGPVAGWVAVCAGSVRRALRARGPERTAWLSVAVLGLTFAVETAYPLRYALTNHLREFLRWVGGEEAVRGRRPVQAGVIALVVVPASVLLAVRVARSSALAGAAKVALAGVLAASVGFVLETISLHHLDRYPWVYRGPRLAGLALAVGGVVWAVMSRGRPPA